MKLQRRHYRVIEFLEANPKKRYGVDEIAKALSLSLSVLRNELPHLALAGYIKRKPDGRTFDYFADPNTTISKTPNPDAKALSKAEFGSLAYALANPNYEPKLNKLAWNLPWVNAQLLNAAVTGDTSQLEPCRSQLTTLLNAAKDYVAVLERLLATPRLWDASLARWLTEGLSEENLEKLHELARQALAAHSRLESSKEAPENEQDN